MNGRFAVLLLCATVSTPVLAADTPTTFDDCERAVARSAQSTASLLCFDEVARRTNGWDEAGRRLETRLTLDPRNAVVRLGLAKIEADRGRGRAEQLYKDGIRGLADSERAADEVRARLAFSNFLGLRGRLDEADAEITRADELAGGAGEPLLHAEVLINQAWQSYRRSDFARGELLLRRIEQDLFPGGPADLRSQWLSAMGAIHWATNRNQDARNDYTSQAELLHQTGDLYEEAAARSNIALAAASLLQGSLEDRNNKLIELVTTSLALARTGGNRRIEAKSHIYLGQMVSSVRERRDHLRRGAALAREIGKFDDYLLGLRQLAYSFFKDEPADWHKGVRLLEEAIDQARRHADLVDVARGWSILAFDEMHRARESGWHAPLRDRAIRSGLTLLDAVEAIRDRQSEDLARARTFSRWTFVYDRVFAYLIGSDQAPPSREDTDLAFRVLERERGRVLLDEMDAAQASTVIASGSSSSQERSRLLGKITALQRRLMAPDLPEGERETLLQELERQELEESATRSAIAASDTHFAAVHAIEFPSLSEVEGALPEDEAILSFHLAPARDRQGTPLGGSCLLVVSRRGTLVYPLPEQSEIEDSVALYLGLLQNRDGSEEAGAVRLYAGLLEKPLAELPPAVDHLVIIPDKGLYQLPFASLKSGVGTEPIGARYTINEVPSTTIWLRLHGSPLVLAEAPALALVDPDLSAFRTRDTKHAGGGVARERAADLVSRAQLGHLPHARDEARDLCRALGVGCRILTGREASERAFKESSPGRFGLLHFAAHAFVDDKTPERSAVVLAPGAEDEDGLLQIREIVDLDLDGRVVVLSSCRSASGAHLQGEGVLSLARAFFVAGARAVVGNLWPVRDDEAAPLFEAFYRHLGAGESLAGALTLARRDRIHAGAPPLAWAGLSLLGDGDFVPFPGGVRSSPSLPRRMIMVGVLLVLAVAAFGILLRRRLHRA